MVAEGGLKKLTAGKTNQVHRKQKFAKVEGKLRKLRSYGGEYVLHTNKHFALAKRASFPELPKWPNYSPIPTFSTVNYGAILVTCLSLTQDDLSFFSAEIFP